MKFVEANVEWWPQTTVAQQIAKVSRICYKSKMKEPDASLSEEEQQAFMEKESGKLCDSLWERGHRSMYRHGSVYYYVKHQGKLPKWIWQVLATSPYIDYTNKELHVWISTNMQYLCEHRKILSILTPYEVTEAEFIAKAVEHDCIDALMLLRMTMVATTQISTTRELNRTSPNNIAEQSTRYVNMKKKGGVQICEPHWWFDFTLEGWDKMKSWLRKAVYMTSCKVSEWAYLLLLKLGLNPQDARGVLPLDTYSVVAYTYNLYEWKHILDLRYHGKTGKPHPNAKIVGELIHDIIMDRMIAINPKFDI